MDLGAVMMVVGRGSEKRESYVVGTGWRMADGSGSPYATCGDSYAGPFRYADLSERVSRYR